MKYHINDFGCSDYLDGVKCRYHIENDEDIVAYVFEKEDAELIVKLLNEDHNRHRS